MEYQGLLADLRNSLEQRRKTVISLMKEKALDSVVFYANGQGKVNPYNHWITHVPSTNTDAMIFFLTKDNEGTYMDMLWSANALRQRISRYGLPEDKILAIDGKERMFDDFKNQASRFRKIGYAGLDFPLSLCDSPEKYVHLPEIDDLLRVKNQYELSIMQKAASNITRDLEQLLKDCFIGYTEDSIAHELLKIAKKYGQSWDEDPRIISGRNLDSTTGRANIGKRLENGFAIAIDHGHIQDGLFTDVTRMHFLGKNPAQEDYERLKIAHYMTIPQLKPGMKVFEILELVKQNISSVGLPAETLCTEALGHGVGFVLHEHPYIFDESDSNVELVENSVITLEPEIKTPNSAIRIEDMVHITKNGGIVLTKY